MIPYAAGGAAGTVEPEPLDAAVRPNKIDSCYGYGAERELVLKFCPQFYRGKAC